MKPIGYVKSPITQLSDQAWGQVIAEIHVDAALTAGLGGLDQFSHVVVVFLMHQATFDATHDLVRRPPGRADMPELGIFAQRAKHRPNPIGVTAVELVKVENNVLTVRGLDAIDGTPVLDIKPYFPVFDQADSAQVPEWVNRLMAGYF